MQIRTLLVTALLGVILAGPLRAEIVVQFRENGARDRITFINISDCPTGPVAFTVDLMDAPANLIFNAPSVGLAQDEMMMFNALSNVATAYGRPFVTKDQSLAAVVVETLPSFKNFSFEADVIDKPEAVRVIRPRVIGSQVAGGVARLILEGGHVAEGFFDGTGQARIDIDFCTLSAD
ncbi:MAG: hypothetical protein AAGJ96_04660 [Pseudomonadota bacterium]